MWTISYEIIYNNALSHTVSAADEMNLVNAMRGNPFSVTACGGHVNSSRPAKSLRLKMKFM